VTRDVERLAAQRYDLVVVGGGIHGLFAAYDAASRGLTVALVDRSDFGSGLTFNHQRTIHGGLRGLQRGQIGKARHDLRERRTWARIAPHYLRPLPFLIGTYRWTRRSRWSLKAGFTLYEALSRGRNHGVSPELHLPKPRLESAAATRRLFPGIADRGLSGGAVWYDYQVRHPERLTWTVALAAERAGATLANYVEVVGPLRAQGKITGVKAVDRLTGRAFDIEAAATLLCAGSGLPLVMSAFGVTGAPPLLRAMNVLLNRPARDIATVAAGPNGKMLTSVPWAGHVLVGTHQSSGVVGPDDTGPTGALVDECLADANAAFPPLKASRGDVLLLHHGLVPAAVSNGRADLLPAPKVLRHRSEGAAGLISLIGVKYTSARAAAERAVDAVVQETGKAHKRSLTSRTPLPHADVADVEGRLVETARTLGVKLDRDVTDHFASWYGTEASDVLRHAAAGRLLDRVHAGSPVLRGEIDYAVTHAQAAHLADAVLRRTPLGAAGHPGPEALRHAADVMAAKLGWTADRIADEIAQVDAVYPPK
jgi:glycerol-3-phosphate dehydrogenase